MPRKSRFVNAGARKGIKEQLDPETLADLYLGQRLTQSQIADRYGCSPQFVSLLLQEYGLSRHYLRKP